MADDQTITPLEIEHIAHLARLEIDPDQSESLHSDLNRILGYVRSLQQLDLAHVEPTTHGSLVATPLRDDTILPSLPIEDVFAAAPQREEDGFAVPKVVG